MRVSQIWVVWSLLFFYPAQSRGFVMSQVSPLQVSRAIHCVTRTSLVTSRVTLGSHSLSRKATTLLITSCHSKCVSQYCRYRARNEEKSWAFVPLHWDVRSAGFVLEILLKFSSEPWGVQRLENWKYARVVISDGNILTETLIISMTLLPARSFTEETAGSLSAPWC